MTIELTPIDLKLIEHYLPLPEEREKWKAEIEAIDGKSERIKIARWLESVCEQNLGVHLQGVIEKKDAFKRLETLSIIASLPEEIPLKKTERDIKDIMASSEHEKALREKLLFF